jgi:hypothetical protein
MNPLFANVSGIRTEAASGDVLYQLSDKICSSTILMVESTLTGP